MNIKSALFLILSTAMLLGNSMMLAEAESKKDTRRNERETAIAKHKEAEMVLLSSIGFFACVLAGGAIGIDLGKQIALALGFIYIKLIESNPQAMEVQNFATLENVGGSMGALAGLVAGAALHEKIERMLEKDPLKGAGV